ncbi:MAG: SDR family oxidoreductase [Candidatus Aminicenantia bacterium]
MSKYLITGGAGFIGSNIAIKLVKEGKKVRILDNFFTGRKENIAPIIQKIELIEGDIKDFQTCLKAVDGVKYVLHQAALPSVPRSIRDPITTNETNVTGTLNILIAARDKKVRRIIYASSSSVYGANPDLPKQEEMKSFPLSPYAVSKLVGEHYCQVFHQIYGLETVILRYFNVFGPNQDPASQYAAVIPKFIKTMLEKNQPTIYGDGKQSRDFTYIDNVIQANLLAVYAKNACGKVFNIASQKRVTINDLVRILNKILKTNIEPIYTEPRPGDVRHSLADISRAKKILGYHPTVGFEEGLEKTVSWFREKLK